MRTGEAVAVGASGALLVVAIAGGAYLLGRNDSNSTQPSRTSADVSPTVATDAGQSQAVAACTAYARPYSTDDEITALQFETNRLAAEAAVANPRWEPLRDAFVYLIELQQPRTAGEQASLGEFSAVLSEARARCLDAGGLDIGGSTG